MTQFLLDTNIVLWLSKDDLRIDGIRDLILSEETQFFISPIVWWEMAIKVRAGKLAVDIELIRFFAHNHGFLELPITSNYIKAYLALSNLHRDPFDHMLLAQAIATPMHFITGDALLADYSSLVMVI